MMEDFTEKISPDGELRRVRDEFVKRVSEGMINQLLDLLLKHSVLDDEEMNSILEEHRTRTKKARALIDAVIRKGPEACLKMIAYLEKRDKFLFQTLGLSSAQSFQSGDRVDNSGKQAKKRERSAGKEKEDKDEEEETACKQARQEDKPDEGKSEKTLSLDLSEKQLLLVAQKLGKEWKQVAIYLDLETRDLEDLEEAEESVIMRKHKMLLKWKQRRKQGEATAYHLLESLKDMKDFPNEVHEILKDMVNKENGAAK